MSHEYREGVWRDRRVGGLSDGSWQHKETLYERKYENILWAIILNRHSFLENEGGSALESS